ncbi:MAG: hypothetical protein MI741_03155, partial [Rhodospirillales bacterium]|nr:hypothetical protein [Rhodospirillales bacterium]
ARAFERIEKIAKQDVQAQAAVNKMTMGSQQYKRWEKSYTSRNESGTPEKKEPTPITNGDLKFFPNLIKEKNDAYTKLAAKRLADARSLMTKGDLPRALATVRPMATKPDESFPPCHEAKQLQDEIYVKIREERESKRDEARKRAAEIRAANAEKSDAEGEDN